MKGGDSGVGGGGVHLLGHPARPTPKAAVALSWQQPYTDRLQCWSAVGSGRDVAEIADEGGRKKEGRGRWEMAQGEKEEQQHLSDYVDGRGGGGVRVGGEGIRQRNLQATCNFFRQQ